MQPRLMALLALVLGLVLPTQDVSAQQRGPGLVSVAATLSILAGPVQRVPAGSSQPRTATDGMSLAVGDRILTGPDAMALVTFLDGSTLTVQPNSDVMVKQAEVGDRRRSNIRVHINLGTVWARVVRLADPKSSFSLESNTATATVHDGLIGAEQKSDGSFVCWTRAGELQVKGSSDGPPVLALQPGQKTTVQPGRALAPEPYFVHQSALKITSRGVLPLILMFDKTRVAGFVTPGIEVNQVFGSFTGAAADGTRAVEVPAGHPGPFVLVLEGLQDGPFRVTLAGLFQGKRIYERELSGTIKKGERFATQITHQFISATTADQRTAEVESGSATPLKPLDGPLPGKILLSPAEVEASGRT